ncbi:MAG: adenylosuccinate synthase [Abditibacteriota bacterium]|nr:adenylosuccinate synthase [Abditibacteriota bacterium]MBP5739256.1 adenylosuccinate synthase [Abditibacteriota bacterium]
MSNAVVIGMQWGDEAKGKIVDYLSGNADLVVRYNGGNNAGHTVVIGEEVYKFHTVPVGILNEGVTAVIADGVVLDPAIVAEELRSLAPKGIGKEKIKISGNTHVLMPWHRLFDNLQETSKGSKKIGTTGRGIGPCYADKISRIGLRMSEFIDPARFKAKLHDILAVKNAIITKVYGGEPLDEAAIYAEYSEYAKELAPLVCDTAKLIFEAADSGKKIVFEGAHGSLLDIDHGTYPYVTSSHCVAGGASIGTGIGPTMIDKVIGITKAYSTRVGEGPFPTELFDEIGDKIRRQGNEFGTTTGRPRRCGWLDTVISRFTARANGTTGVALTLLDVLTGFDTIKVCAAYEIDGKITRDFPTDVEVLAKAKPVYEEMKGWSEDISECKRFEQLPEAARKYVKRVEQLIESPICVLGVGRRRDQSIILDHEIMTL